MPLNSKYNVVYWGGPTAETNQLWSFHISRARPRDRNTPASRTTLDFDEHLDKAVDMATEGLRVLTDFEAEGERIALKSNMLLAFEGSTVYLEHIASKACTPITFPNRQPARYQNAVVLPP